MKYNKKAIYRHPLVALQTANQLRKRGYTLSQSFRKKWELAKNITSYNPEQINVQLVRESNNHHDGTAIAVMVGGQGEISGRLRAVRNIHSFLWGSESPESCIKNMDNKLQIFKNEEFEEVRTIKENGEIYFFGSDVAKALGYSKPHDAMLRH